MQTLYDLEILRCILTTSFNFHVTGGVMCASATQSYLKMGFAVQTEGKHANAVKV